MEEEREEEEREEEEEEGKRRKRRKRRRGGRGVRGRGVGVASEDTRDSEPDTHIHRREGREKLPGCVHVCVCVCVCVCVFVSVRATDIVQLCAVG